MTGVIDLSGPQLALLAEAYQVLDEFLRKADWSNNDKTAVAQVLGVPFASTEAAW